MKAGDIKPGTWIEADLPGNPDSVFWVGKTGDHVCFLPYSRSTRPQIYLDQGQDITVYATFEAITKETEFQKSVETVKFEKAVRAIASKQMEETLLDVLECPHSVADERTVARFLLKAVKRVRNEI